MEKEFLKYEEALALKELGFDETCFASYGIKLKSGKEIPTLYGCGVIFFDKDDFITQKTSNILCSTPTFSQTFRWFREKYNLQLGICHIKGGFDCWTNDGDLFENGKYCDFKTYEEAELECLKKLIEIVKNK